MAFELHMPVSNFSDIHLFDCRTVGEVTDWNKHFIQNSHADGMSGGEPQIGVGLLLTKGIGLNANRRDISYWLERVRFRL